MRVNQECNLKLHHNGGLFMSAHIMPLSPQRPAPGISAQPQKRPLLSPSLAPAVKWSSIGDVSREFSITLRALRFYESKGLIRPLRQGSQRLYSVGDRARIGMILSAKELGFTLAEISGMLADGDTSGQLSLGPDTVLRQIAFMERQHAAIESALAALRMRYYTMTEPA
jgi:DNA-binding transcriptional MerR regulator